MSMLALPPPQKQRPWLGLAVAVLYGATSVSITFFNKAVFHEFHFNYPNAVTLGQNVFSVLVLAVLGQLGVLQLPAINRRTLRAMAPLSSCFFVMVLSGLAALKFVNVPVYTALRRSTTFVVIVGERLLRAKRVPADESMSVYVMVAGGILAGWGDANYSVVGYTLIAVNCVVTAVYLIYISKKSAETGLDTIGLMLYNNLLSSPPIAVLVYVFEWDGLCVYPRWRDVAFQSCLFTSLALAIALNYLIFMCSTVNSPLTTSVTGQIKNLLQTALGLVMFSDVTLTPLLVVGLGVSTLATLWYGYIKYAQKRSDMAKVANKLLEDDNEQPLNLPTYVTHEKDGSYSV